MAILNGIISLLIALIMAFFTIVPARTSREQSIERVELVQGMQDPLSLEPQADDDKAWALIVQAQDLFEEGFPDKAVALLRMAGVSQDEQVRLVCANGLMELGDLEGAEPILRSLIGSNPETNFQLRYDLSGLLFDMGRMEEASALLEESLALRPEDSESVLAYANVLIFHSPEPIQPLDGLIALHPDIAQLLVLKAWWLGDQWDYAQALAATSQALALAKSQSLDLPWYYWQQYQIQKKMGEFPQALKTLNRALSPGDDLPNYLERVDLLMWNLHNLPAALEDLNALALKYDRDPQVLYLRMLTYLRLKQFDQARADLTLITDETLALLMQGLCALYEENAPLAAQALDAYLALSPQDVPGLLYRAILSNSLEDDPAASAGFAQQVIAVDPHNADAYRLLGEAYEDMGQWSLAESAYRQAIALTSEDPDPAMLLTTLLLAWGRTEDSLDVLEAAQRQYPNWNATLNAQMTYLLAQEAYAPVLEILQTYQEKFVSLADRLEPLRAIVLAATGEREQSLSIFGKCLETPDVEIYSQYAYALVLLGDYDQAAVALKAGHDLSIAYEKPPTITRRQSIDALVTGAELYQAQGHLDKALQLLEQACTLRWIPLEANLSPQLKTLMDTDAFKDLLERYPVE